jgi:hypothetical protein
MRSRSPKNRGDDPLTKLGQTRDGVRLADRLQRHRGQEQAAQRSSRNAEAMAA